MLGNKFKKRCLEELRSAGQFTAVPGNAEFHHFFETDILFFFVPSVCFLACRVLLLCFLDWCQVELDMVTLTYRNAKLKKCYADTTVQQIYECKRSSLKGVLQNGKKP